MELQDSRLGRLFTSFAPLKFDDDQSFTLLSPRVAETPRIQGKTTYADVLSSLVQQIEISSEKASAGQRKTIRESIVRECLKAGGNSFRAGRESLVNSFADFEELNMSRFDFMENETELPETVTKQMNLDQVSREALLARIQRLELSICSERYPDSSMQLLDELEEREALQQTRDQLQRAITKLLDEY